MSNLAIKTTDLTKIFKQRSQKSFLPLFFRHRNAGKEIVAVDHISLEIKKGEIFGLIGPNGAGKTTFIKMLSILLTPDEGEAFVNGFHIMRNQMEVKKSVGTLFSIGERGFFWRLNVFRNLEFYASLYNIPRNERLAKIVWVMKILGLEEMSSTAFQELSAGMKRRLALARALLPDPPILLLDEPTLHLDVSSSRTIRNFIKTELCQKQRKTILYTTNHVDEVDQICDSVAVIHRGKIIAYGSPSTIKSIVDKGKTVTMTVQNINQTHLNKIRSLEGIQDFKFTKRLSEDIYDIEIKLKNKESISTLLDFVQDNRIKLLDMNCIGASLEDALVELIRSKDG